MGSEEDAVTQQRVVDARARNISHNVRCTECGSQSIEDSQADIAILLRKVFLFSLFFKKNCIQPAILYYHKFSTLGVGPWFCTQGKE